MWKTSQTLKWEGVWRELGCLARTASFAVREESGHSLKSSLSVFVVCFILDTLTVRQHCVLRNVNTHGLLWSDKRQNIQRETSYYLCEQWHFVFQHAMVIDTRNSSILPKKGGLLKIHQVCSSRFNQSFLKCCMKTIPLMLWLCRNLLVTLEEMLVSWRRTLRSSSTEHYSGTL